LNFLHIIVTKLKGLERKKESGEEFYIESRELPNANSIELGLAWLQGSVNYL
tara:strand:- start:31 stop:186 length:156 start_codon:yes stop_codon:yes gene_type:complete